MRIRLLIIWTLTFLSCNTTESNYSGFESEVHQNEIDDLFGSWKISSLIANSQTEEYFLYPKSDDPSKNYGNSITLKPDGTFVSAYSADCGNDCFTSTFGKYKMIDENYICFFLEKITHDGDCSGESEPKKDLGKYYFYNGTNQNVLFKSTGDLEQDKAMAKNIDLVTSKAKEIYQYNGLLRWINTELSEEESIAFCLKENIIDEYEVLYSRKIGHLNTTIFLIKSNDEYYYVLYKKDYKNSMVALFDDSFAKQIDEKSKLIENDTSLKMTSYKHQTNKNNAEVFKKETEIKKIIYNQYFSNGVSSVTTYYFQNNIPFYVENNIDFDSYVSTTGFYISDWEINEGFSKIISNNGNISDIYSIKSSYERLMKFIK
jgi:hypothetical protein